MQLAHDHACAAAGRFLRERSTAGRTVAARYEGFEPGLFAGPLWRGRPGPLNHQREIKRAEPADAWTRTTNDRLHDLKLNSTKPARKGFGWWTKVIRCN